MANLLNINDLFPSLAACCLSAAETRLTTPSLASIYVIEGSVVELLSPVVFVPAQYLLLKPEISAVLRMFCQVTWAESTCALYGKLLEASL
jgi:hypothetical protein